MRRKVMTARAVIVWAAGAAALFMGCSSNVGASRFRESGGSAGTDESSGGPGSGGSLANGGGGIISGSGGSGETGGSGNGGGTTVDPASACAKGTDTATLAPVNMFVTFDKSQSMSMNNKWTDATTAFVAFFRDAGTAGLRVAFRFFPDSLPTPGCDDQGCSLDACSQPLVPLAPLTADPAPMDTQEGKLVGELQTAMPGGRTGGGGNRRDGGRGAGGTPLYAALGGAEQWAGAYQMAHPDEKTVVILMTDGEPNGCIEDITMIAGLATTALQTHKILTYAIGLEGSAQTQMDDIARAGGTTMGYFIGGGTNAQMDLLNALTAIRGKSISCDFAMPKASAGQAVDPAQINVNYTPSTGGATETLKQVPNMAGCGTGKSWYYDNPANPTRITLCPSACQMAQADQKAKLEILLGCATVVSVD